MVYFKYIFVIVQNLSKFCVNSLGGVKFDPMGLTSNTKTFFAPDLPVTKVKFTLLNKLQKCIPVLSLHKYAH